MRLRVMAVSWLLATAACAGISAPLESTPSFEPGHAMHDSFQLLQGMTLDRGGSRLAFQGGDGRGGAKVDVWDAQESVWQAHWRLAPGQLFAAGGGFLRVEGVEPGARATAVASRLRHLASRWCRWTGAWTSARPGSNCSKSPMMAPPRRACGPSSTRWRKPIRKTSARCGLLPVTRCRLGGACTAWIAYNAMPGSCADSWR